MTPSSNLIQGGVPVHTNLYKAKMDKQGEWLGHIPQDEGAGRGSVS